MDKAVIKISEDVLVPATGDEVWALLSDAEAVLDCFPGASLRGVREDGQFEGSMTMRFGPTRIELPGTASVAWHEDERSGSIVANGGDRYGNRASVRAEFKVLTGVETNGTVIAVTAELQIGGVLANFARSGGQRLAISMLRDFSTCLASRIAPPFVEPLTPSKLSERVRLLVRRILGRRTRGHANNVTVRETDERS